MNHEPIRQGTPTQRDDLFRLLVASVKDYAIFHLDPQGYIQTWNDGAQRIKGYTADAIIGQHFSIFYPPEEVRRGKTEYVLRVARDEGRYEEEGWRIRKDGSRFWASVVITALYDPAGTLVGFGKVTRDLSERKQAEEERVQLLALERTARAEAEAAVQQLRAVQQVTEVALTHLTLDALLDALLEQLRELLAVDTVVVLLATEDVPEALVVRAGNGLEAGLAPDQSRAAGQSFAEQVARERHPLVLDNVAQVGGLDPGLRDSGLRSLVGVPLLIAGRVIGVVQVGTRYVRTFRPSDIQFLQIVADRVALAIDHARLYETARAARAEAEVAAAKLRAQDAFLAVAAHELKTPMTSAKATSQLLLRRFARDGTVAPQRVEPALRTIEQQVDRLARLVTQLLETVRVQAGRLTLQRTRTNIAALVRGAVEQARTASDAHQLVVVAPEEVWAWVDAPRLEQVVTNLLDNAIKFSPAGGRVAVEVTAGAPDQVRIAVRDWGIGVPAEHRSHLFERFYQAHGESYQSGLGLGLYLCREIVAQHGGTLAAEFPPDGGTRFVAAVPVGAPSDGERADSRLHRV